MPDLITQDNRMNVTLSEGVSMVGSSLVVSKNVTFENMQKAVDTLIAMERVTAWCIGDAINASDEIFGERASQMISMTGMSYSYLMQCSSMANRFTPEDRLNCSFSHHRIVQKFDAEKRRRYLQFAIDNDMGLAEFKAWVRKQEGQQAKENGEEGPSDYVIGVMEAPIQRGQIWELLANEDAKELTAEQLESLGIPLIKDQSKMIIIVPRYDQSNDDERGAEELKDTDESIKGAETQEEVPFG